MDQQGDAGQPNRRIEIRHRFTVNTLYEGNHPDLRAAVEHAVRTGVDLSHADLSHANLRHANLSHADLSHANLSHANLSHADLRLIRADFAAVLRLRAAEIPAFRVELVEGRIDGSTYTGDCACLVGTLARIRHCNHDEMPDLKPDSSRPIERFFLAINKGDTPETNPVAAIVLQWLDEIAAEIASDQPRRPFRVT